MALTDKNLRQAVGSLALQRIEREPREPAMSCESTTFVTSRALLIASESDRLRSMMSSTGPTQPDDVIIWYRCSTALSGLPHLTLGPPAVPLRALLHPRTPLMVVYPTSWSICIIGPAWSLIVLYFAPALALWRIGTPVDSQVWLCTSSARPPSPMPAGERWL
ncbi:hypothetical protein GGX14DRAFT_567166 [Mycena pura]|uniref:Uncharacterized protein n=1 Tax=Mycena pura TaxID=153505 RepID=A0AAD6YA21_9AGAR|nr:hypothetical protein GGX14DRAFT_567166 [Mycena pura]